MQMKCAAIIWRCRSSAESFQVPMFTNGVQDCHAFNLGFRSNFIEVFGDDPKLWFLPIFSRWVLLSFGCFLATDVPMGLERLSRDDENDRRWFAFSFGNGLKYPTRFIPLPSNYNTMDSVLNLSGTQTLASMSYWLKDYLSSGFVAIAFET